MIYICISLLIPSIGLFFFVLCRKKASNKVTRFIKRNSLSLQLVIAGITISSSLYVGFVQVQNNTNIIKEQYYLEELNKTRIIKGLYARIHVISSDLLLYTKNNRHDTESFLTVDSGLMKMTALTIQQIPYLDMPNDQIALDLSLLSNELMSLSDKWNTYLITKDPKQLNEIKQIANEITTIASKGLALTHYMNTFYENKITNIDNNSEIYRYILKNSK